MLPPPAPTPAGAPRRLAQTANAVAVSTANAGPGGTAVSNVQSTAISNQAPASSVVTSTVTAAPGEVREGCRPAAV